MQTCSCCTTLHCSSQSIVGSFPMSCGEEVPLCWKLEVFHVKGQVYKVLSIFCTGRQHHQKSSTLFQPQSWQSRILAASSRTNGLPLNHVLSSLKSPQSSVIVIHLGWHVHNKRMYGCLVVVPVVTLNSILDYKTVVFREVSHYNDFSFLQIGL